MPTADFIELNQSSPRTTQSTADETLRRKASTASLKHISCAMETRESQMKVHTDVYGKSTKAFEMRRRVNLAKARKLAVKMENHKIHSDQPLVKLSPIKSPPPPPPHPKADPISTIRKPNTTRPRSPTYGRPIERRSARSTGGGGGGISNLPPNRLKKLGMVQLPTEQRTPRHKNVECQTSVTDISNWQVLADAKIMHPTPALWASILKKREDDARRAMLKEERYVPEYSKAEVNYQTNLKEFLETGTVRHYERDLDNSSEEFLKIKPSKTEDMKRALRYKAPVKPEMDLKKRLPKIEEELLKTYKSRA